MLKTRVITGLLLAGSFLFVLLHPNAQLFYAFCWLAIMLAAWEWSALCEISTPYRIVFMALVALLTVAIVVPAVVPAVAPAQLDQSEILTTWLGYALVSALVLWLLLATAVIRFPASKAVWNRGWVKSAIGVMVLVQAWAAVVFLKEHENPSEWILLVIAIVALADIGAYFAGRRFGKAKLAVHVSPGKTWEGYLGGLIMTTSICLFAASFRQSVFFADAGWPQFVVLMILIASMSVIGDLSMSMFKRVAGVKDSGSILPGHGGVLDRIDGMLAAVPIFACVLWLYGW